MRLRVWHLQELLSVEGVWKLPRGGALEPFATRCVLELPQRTGLLSAKEGGMGKTLG